jgi:uncharacterized protein (DUF1330 family)
MAGDTRHVQSYALHVADDAMYRRYREGMTPILERHGGGFAYDFVVAQVLASETTRPINRVFLIRFPTAERAAAFFADPGYLAVRRAWFEPAVDAVTQLAAYDEPIPGGAATAKQEGR